MGKKKGKEKDKSKKQPERPSTQPEAKPDDTLKGVEGSEQSLVNAMKAARESAMALQEAASAFSRQMNATNELLTTQAAQQGHGADFAADTLAGAGSSMGQGKVGASHVDASSAAAELGIGARATDIPHYGSPQYADSFTNAAAPYAGAPYAEAPYGYAQGAQGYASSYRPQVYQRGQAYPPQVDQRGQAYAPQVDQRGQAYQPYVQEAHTQMRSQSQPSPYGASYQGYSSPYAYGAPDAAAAAATQAQSRAAARQVAAAQNAAFSAASKANAASAAAAMQESASYQQPSQGTYQTTQGASYQQPSQGTYQTTQGAYSAYSQNPAYAVNEDLLTNLPKFGEAPYPLPEPQEILESVPSLQSLAYGATAAQMQAGAYEPQASASTQASNSNSSYFASEQGSYFSSQANPADDDGVLFAYVEEAEPIDLVEIAESKKNKKKKGNSEDADYAEAQYASASEAYGNQGVEEISIPAMYGSEEGFAVEFPTDSEDEARGSAPAPEEVSAVYYEVDDGAQASGYQAAYYNQPDAAGYGAQAQPAQAYDSWNQDANAYEGYNEYYYDDAGNVFYYDENGYPYYYDEAGNAYYYDGYDGNNNQSAGAPKGTGLVLGILSILLAFIPIVGLILAIVASKKAKKHINAGGMSSNAYTARLCGRIGLILSILLLVAYVGLVVAFFLSLYPPTVMGAIRTFLATTPLSFIL